MKIVTEFDGEQKKFHWYWLPLMYKHQDCQFFVKGDFIYPKDVPNLKVNQEPSGKGPTLRCPMNRVPTYRAMAEFVKKKPDWDGTHEDLGERFYEV